MESVQKISMDYFDYSIQLLVLLGYLQQEIPPIHQFSPDPLEDRNSKYVHMLIKPDFHLVPNYQFLHDANQNFLRSPV
jgi:hypothetical protein